jgi:hypothetical protein
VDENTTLGMAARGSSDILADIPDMTRYVVAPMSVVCDVSESDVIQSRYSGPPMPHSPGQPSAAA